MLECKRYHFIDQGGDIAAMNVHKVSHRAVVISVREVWERATQD